MNTSYEKLSFYNTFFGGSIEGDNIMSTDFYGNKTVVGVTMKKHQETLDLLNQYYEKLVELGVIEKEKTPEDVAKEQQEMMKQMMLQMQAMQEKIDNMNKDIVKGGKNEHRANGNNNSQQNESQPDTTTVVEPVNKQGKRASFFGKQSD